MFRWIVGSPVGSWNRDGTYKRKQHKIWVQNNWQHTLRVQWEAMVGSLPIFRRERPLRERPITLTPALPLRLFTCGKADRSRRAKCSFFLLIIWSKRTKTAPTNLVVYVFCAINFKFGFRFDLRGCLEAVLASKHHF